MKIAARLVAHMHGDIRAQDVYAHDGVADHADRVMAELVALGVEDPHIAVDFEHGLVEMSFNLDIETDDHVEAGWQAFSTLRSAIHAAGGNAPGWESLSWETEPAEDSGLVQA